LLRHQIGSSPSSPEKLGAILSAAAAGGMFGEQARALIAASRDEKADWLRLVDEHDPAVSDDLRLFLQDRLRVHLREVGTRHDIIDAVIAPGSCNLFLITRRVAALGRFLDTEDGRNLLAGYKRAANILKAEEKKDGKTFISEVTENLLSEAAEKALFAALTKARAAITAALDSEDFAAAMQQMAALRVPVDGFFEGVKVNADDKPVRENRLNLLASLRATLHQVADFSKIEG
jgi:glycyl-tRNA synthetase beta chain